METESAQTEIEIETSPVESEVATTLSPTPVVSEAPEGQPEVPVTLPSAPYVSVTASAPSASKPSSSIVATSPIVPFKGAAATNGPVAAAALAGFAAFMALA